MIKEMNEIIVGFDLGREFSQITFYNRKTSQPVTVRTVEDQEKYLIDTPRDLFPMVEDGVELGSALLSNFIKECLMMIPGFVPESLVRIAVTMEAMTDPWPRVLYDALSMAGIERENVYLQNYRQSFFCYTINQKRELWNYRVGLFGYEDSRITAYELGINYKTKPALAVVNQIAQLELNEEVRGKSTERDWNVRRDELFLELIDYVFKNKTFSSVFLIGDSFDKTWAVRSLQSLCNKRHVFQGRNLYTKGACYGAMMRNQTAKTSDILYVSEDMVEANIGMQMSIGGRDSYYLCVDAGVNWFEVYHSWEFILDGTNEITLFTKPIDGSSAKSHTLVLKDLPNRPNKTTRIGMEVSFESVHVCRILVKDMGFGELYPTKGQIWEMVLEV